MYNCLGCVWSSPAKESSPLPSQDCIFLEEVPFYNSHGEIIRTKEPGGLQPTGSQSWTRLSN